MDPSEDRSLPCWKRSSAFSWNDASICRSLVLSSSALRAASPAWRSSSSRCSMASRHSGSAAQCRGIAGRAAGPAPAPAPQGV
eukprot:10832931-Lingulodinium_polyedra.AAC.1